MKNFKSNLKQTVRAFPLLVVMLLCSSAVLAVPGWSNTNMTARQSTADELTDRQVSSAWQPTYQGYQSQIFEVGTTNVPSDYSEVSSSSSDEQGGHKGHLRKLGGGTDPGEQSELSPIGEPWIMLLFALLACGVIAYRRMNIKHHSIMKKIFTSSFHEKLKMLLIAIGLMVTSLTSQMWAANYYAAGSITAWAQGNDQKMTQVGATTTYYKVISSKNAGDYQFRVTEGNWETSHGWSQVNPDCSDFTLTKANDNDNNININLPSTTAKLTIWFNAGSNKIWVTTGDYSTQTIYVIGSNSWTDSNVKAHVWKGTADYYAWANDQQMTNSSNITRAGITYKVYSYTVPKTYTSVIFRYGTGNSDKTGDLSWNASTPYYSVETSEWYASTTDALAKYLVGENWTGASWENDDAANIMTDNGDGSYSKNISITDATKEIALKITAKGNWSVAWNKDAKGTGYNLSQALGGSDNLTFKVSHAGTTKITLTSTGQIDVYAPYQVSYAAGTGATGTVSASAVTTYGSTCTLSSSTFSKTGYTQDGWATADGGAKVYDLGGTYTGGYVDVTLYPHWAANTYSITYKDQGGGAFSGTQTDAPTTHTYGTATTLKIPTKSGHMFGGWFTTSACTAGSEVGTTSSASLGATDYTADITLYAKWTEITVSATVNPSSGTVGSNSLTFSITSNVPTDGGYYVAVYNFGLSEHAIDYINGDKAYTSSPTSYTGNPSFASEGTFYTRVVVLKDAAVVATSDKVSFLVATATYSVTIASANATMGSVSPTSISASADSWSSNITANPSAGYQFVNWTSSGGGITINGNTANPTQIKATSKGGTLTAHFSAATYRVTLDNQSATSAGTESVDATYNTTTLTTITKPTKTNYTFGGYYTATDGGGTQIIDANGNWLANKSGFTDGSNKSIITENKTLYAKWTETTYAVTVAVDDASHAAGVIVCSAAGWEPSKSGTAQIGSLTNVTITVGAPAAGYKFDGGYWTLTGGVTLVSGPLTNPSITVNATAAGSAIFTYAEDLSSTYYVEGDASGPFTYGWNANENTMMKKRSGSSTSSDVYWELEVPSSKTSPGDNQWEFKIYNDASTTGEKWYGWGNGTDHYWLTKANNNLTLSTTGSNTIYLKCYVEGTYTFHVNYSTPASPTLEVIWPVVNQLRISSADPADAGNTGNYDLVEGSDNDWSVSRTLNANTTYTFKMVYEGDWYGKNSTNLTRASNTANSLSTSGNDMTIVTDVAGSYTFTFNSSSKNLTVTYPTAYRISYNANGADDGTAPATSDYYAVGADAILAGNVGNLCKNGYAFKGWNTLATGEGASYAPEGTYTNIQSDVTLYAQWEENDKIMYYYNNNSWGTVKAHIWHYGTPEWSTKGAYPGVAMTNHQGQVYKINYCSSVENAVVFNNGGSGSGNQTADLTIADGLTGNYWFYNDEVKDVNADGIHHGWSQYILVANFPTSTVAAVVGEKVTVVPTVVWADGINFSDINITSTRASGSEKINAVVSGTNIIVSGSEAGTATFNITYTYSTHSEATITKTLTVKVMNGLTIQAKIPSNDDHWIYSNIVKMHYWGGADTDANPSFEGDVTMSWIKDVADGKYYQACVPVGTEATPKTNFLFFYDNFNDAWRKTQNVTDVTENSCYTINHDAGLDKQRNAVKEGTGLCSESWNIQITMGSGDIYTSNIVSTSDEIVSFFAPSNASESQSYRRGVVTIEHNGASVATVPASTFTASGVYTAKINTTTPALTNVAPYTGDYYIRTDGADGGWDNYTTNPDNLMTEFTRNTNFPNETFSYYWVKNVAKNKTENIKATVANDYNPVLCNFTADETANATDGVNLRFGYEPTTNDIVRGIVGGSTTNNFLNIVCATGSLIYKDIDCTILLDETHYQSTPFDSKFQDKSNWVYEVIVYAKIDATHPVANVVLKSYYKGINYLLGMVKDSYGRETSTPVSFPVIKTGTTPGVYGLRVVYDFKTNRLFAAWAPADRVIDGILDVDADVMFLRHEDGDAAQISFKTTSSEIVDIKQAIFALELDNEDTKHKGTGNIERHYFISLPFDCKVSNIFGIGGFMNYWGIQRYNGAKRAQIGWFQETPTFWEWLSADDVMKAGEGYLLSVDKKALENGGVWKDGIIYQKQEVIINPSTGQPYKAQDGSDSIAWKTYSDGSMLTMYFPSTTSGFTITPATGESLTITYPDQPCSITRDDRDKKDSNWKCIGTPGYKNVEITKYSQASPELVVNAAPRFLYEFHEQTTGATWAKGTYTVTDGSEFTYHSFHSYMVQFAGTIDWAQYSKGDVAPSPIAPKRMPTADTKITKVEIELLSSDDDALDRTFVWLQENATIGFDQNYDLNKMIEKKANQIYSLAENEVPFAANVLPLETDTVKLVVNIAQNGEFIFSLEQDKHVGMAPILYDMYKSEQINLLNSDYLVELEKGKYEDRFFLLFQPEAPIVTNFETTADGGQNVHSSEAIYDVLGRRVNTIYPGHLYIVNGEKRIAK